MDLLCPPNIKSVHKEQSSLGNLFSLAKLYTVWVEFNLLTSINKSVSQNYADIFSLFFSQEELMQQGQIYSLHTPYIK